MADYKETQKKYTQARAAYTQAAKEFYQARQQYQLLERKISEFLATSLLSSLPEAHELNVQRVAALNKLTSTEAASVSAKNALAEARTEFNSLGPANITVANLNDNTPILLLPLRLQTRFLTIKHIARNLPDDVMIDPSKLDVATRENIKTVVPDPKPKTNPLTRVSSQVFTLSNNNSQEARRVVTALNEAHSATQKRLRKVEDDHELWVRIFPDDIFLKTHESALTESEMASAKIFWQAMWDAEREFRRQGSGAAALSTKNEQQLEAWKTLRIECLAHRANWIARVMRPVDYPDSLPADMAKIPDTRFPDPGIKSDSWTIPPATDMLPENFIVKVFFKGTDVPAREVVGNAIPDYIQMGFDPDEKDDNAFAGKGKVLELPAAIRWLTDLAEAEKSGMAVRIVLSQVEFSVGVSKIVVVGLKTGADEAEGSRLLTTLFDNHHYKPDGMAFLPHGTSTNNLAGQSSGFNQAGMSAEQSFNNEFPAAANNDPDTDGRRLSMALGLEQNTFSTIFNNNRQEGKEALVLNRLLWPGTLGYYLDNHMRPVITDADIAYIKNFFQEFVTGRGLLPSFRVGKQPYGIVPATAWSAWKPDANAGAEEKRLLKFLNKMDGQWGKLVGSVKTMKKVFENTNEEQLKKDFRELITLQASSTRYFRRLVAGEYLLWATATKVSIFPSIERVGIKTKPDVYKSRLESADGWNEPVNTRPRILGKFFDDDNYKLTDLPPDVAAGLNLINDKGTNYLSILADATFEQLKTRNFGEPFTKFVSQRASKLMFYLARFSLLQGWVESATRLLRKENPAISPFARLDFEMEYTSTDAALSNDHQALLNSSGIAGNFQTLKNKWSFFEQSLSDGTRIDAKILQQLKENLTADDPVKNLQDSMNALTELSALPIDRLERLFSEHIDICGFRLDAWLQGLALSRLSDNRKKQGFEKGLFIGSFGYLEELKPGANPWIQVKQVITPQVVTLQEAGANNVVMPVVDFSGIAPDKLAATKKLVFAYLGSDPATLLTEDPVSGQIVQTENPAPISESGFVLTPSIEHAATASILRAGYEHHSLSIGPESKTLAVSIASERTGWAMDILKSLQAGHSLNEQLGYFIERRMYDNAALAEFIPALRLAFPLQIERNEWDDDQQIGEQDKVRNTAMVTDGLEIIHKIQGPAAGWADKLTEIFLSAAPPRNEFGKIVAQALDQFDAVSDLILAESVFQTVKGSPERAAAALRMAGDAAEITLPEVVNIPSENRVLTHRFGFVFNASNDLENAWPVGSSPASVYTRLSPAVNRWLADQLPSPERIVAKIITADNTLLKVKPVKAGIQAIDLFYLLQKTGLRPEESLLSWWCTETAKATPGVDPQNILGVSFDRDESFLANELSIREIIPLIRSIGTMLEQCRPLLPQDFQVTADSTFDGYDNSSLTAVCREFADNSANGPIVQYLKKLTEAKTALENNLPVGFGSAQSDAAFGNLIRLIPQAFFIGFWDALPACPDICSQGNASILLDQCANIIAELTKRIAVAGVAFTSVSSQASALSGDKLFESLSTLAKQFGGEDFLVLPNFRLPDPGNISAAFNDNSLAASAGEFGIEEWIQGLSMVRDNIRRYQMLSNLRSVFEAPANNRNVKILQLPYIPGGPNQWIGVKFPEGFVPPPQVTSMAYEFSSAFNSAQLISGILVDDWREKVPLPELTAGISVKYDQSNAEAPQCLLLLVAPELKGAWDWQSIVGSVVETIELAKKRAVDGEIIQTTWLSQFLPAVVTPVDAKINTPDMDFKWAGPSPKPIVTGGMGGAGGAGTGGVFTF